jgi:fructosamine-3-kinase
MDFFAIANAISEETGRIFILDKQSAASGGYINQTYRIRGEDGRLFFLKINEAAQYPLLLSEVAGLHEISICGTLRTPKVVTYGKNDAYSFLVLEHLELKSHGNAKLLGEQLASMHRCTSERFGFGSNNYIGATAQMNAWKNDWISFYREYRLGFQLQLARNNGLDLDAPGEKLLECLPEFFTGHVPMPSLLHGDLWNGNHAYLADGTPVIFDPAVYYGDRECDIAMTELFGGYAQEFHSAYRANFPLDAGYALRRELYNLYHILNHANMFGGGYVAQSKQMMQKLLALR